MPASTTVGPDTVMVGATVSCSHEKETGSDWLPAGSTAHTVSVWLPSGRFENVGHCPHVAGACPSSWHRNVPLMARVIRSV